MKMFVDIRLIKAREEGEVTGEWRILAHVNETQL
jgi:hypothetical protein